MQLIDISNDILLIAILVFLSKFIFNATSDFFNQYIFCQINNMFYEHIIMFHAFKKIFINYNFLDLIDSLIP